MAASPHPSASAWKGDPLAERWRLFSPLCSLEAQETFGRAVKAQAQKIIIVV
jgi:hypothetical protein